MGAPACLLGGAAGVGAGVGASAYEDAGAACAPAFAPARDAVDAVEDASNDIDDIVAGRTLFKYQTRGVQWMCREERAPTRLWGQSVRGGLLCDDMGLGKTIQTLALILRRPVARTLVVAPVAVARPWQEALCEAGCAVWEVQPGDRVRRVVLAPASLSLASTSGSKPKSEPKPEPKHEHELEPESESEPDSDRERERARRARTRTRTRTRTRMTRAAAPANTNASDAAHALAMSAEKRESEGGEDEDVDEDEGEGEDESKESKARGTRPERVLRYGAPINIESMPSTGEEAGAGPCVVVATYGAVKPRERRPKDVETGDATIRPFATIAWDRIVADEGHVLRTPSTLVALRMQRLIRAPRAAAWVLTGTPVHNSLEDLFALMAFLGYNLMGVNRRGDEGLSSAAAAWGAKAMRRTMADMPADVRVGMAYPAEDFVVVTHEVAYRSDAEAEFYRSATGILEDQIAALERYADRQQAAQHRLVITSFVRMLAVNPSLYIAACNKQRAAEGLPQWPPWEGRVSKNEQVMELVQSWAGARASFVLFTHFAEELEQFKSVLGALGFPALIIDGTRSAAARFETLAQSRQLAAAGTAHALLVQIRAGGVGLNAQHISRVVIPSPDWSVAAEAQAIARCHRIGQTERVEVHRFVLADVVRAGMQIERHILAKQAEKRVLIDAIVTSIEPDPGAETRAALAHDPFAHDPFGAAACAAGAEAEAGAGAGGEELEF